MKLKNPGIFYALVAAVLFGVSTPVAKLLLAQLNPWLLAGLLYLGSGVGLGVLFGINRWIRRTPKQQTLRGSAWGWFLGSTFFGGALGPVLLMCGLSEIQAAPAALLLNFEGVFTALLAWIWFKEATDRYLVLGMFLIVLGGFWLSWHEAMSFNSWHGPVLILAACLAWGMDNNLTRHISHVDSVQIAMLKSIIAGTVNVLLALALGAKIPGALIWMLSGVVGFIGYGLSLVCFVLALRHLGTARSGAYFSLAPLSVRWVRSFLQAAILHGLY